MEEILNLVSNLKLKCYIMGDFNINLFNMDNNVLNYITLFQSFNFFQTIIKPTRVTDISATVIDHFWTNDTQNYIKSCILHTSISDHFPVWSSFSIVNEKSTPKVCITKRIYNTNEITAFKEDLKKYDWELDLSNSRDIDNIYVIF